MNWLKTIKQAALGNFQYQIPENKRQLIYDFYMASFLYQDKESYKDEFLGELVQETKHKLISDFKAQLLDDVFFILSAEIRHFPDEFGGNAEEALAKVDTIKKDKNKKAILTYAENLRTIQSKLKQKFVELGYDEYTSIYDISEQHRQELGFGKGRNYNYDFSYMAIKELCKTPKQTAHFVGLMERMYRAPIWRQGYGGSLWAEIAHSWLELNNAKTDNEAIVWMDHLIDLQHNSDTLFDKLNSYKGKAQYGISGYEWIKAVLDHKAQAISPYEILENCSPKMKLLATRALHDTLGSSWENNQQAIYGYWKNYIINNPERLELVPEGVLKSIPREEYIEQLKKSLSADPHVGKVYLQAGAITSEDFKEVWTQYFFRDPSNLDVFSSDMTVNNLFTEEDVSKLYDQFVNKALTQLNHAPYITSMIIKLYKQHSFLNKVSPETKKNGSNRLFDHLESNSESLHDITNLDMAYGFFQFIDSSKIENFISKRWQNKSILDLIRMGELFNVTHGKVSPEFAANLLRETIKEYPLTPLASSRYASMIPDDIKQEARQKIINAIQDPNKDLKDIMVFMTNIGNTSGLFSEQEMNKLRVDIVYKYTITDKDNLESKILAYKAKGKEGLRAQLEGEFIHTLSSYYPMSVRDEAMHYVTDKLEKAFVSSGIHSPSSLGGQGQENQLAPEVVENTLKQDFYSQGKNYFDVNQTPKQEEGNKPKESPFVEYPQDSVQAERNIDRLDKKIAGQEVLNIQEFVEAAVVLKNSITYLSQNYFNQIDSIVYNVLYKTTLNGIIHGNVQTEEDVEERLKKLRFQDSMDFVFKYIAKFKAFEIFNKLKTALHSKLPKNAQPAPQQVIQLQAPQQAQQPQQVSPQQKEKSYFDVFNSPQKPYFDVFNSPQNETKQAYKYFDIMRLS